MKKSISLMAILMALIFVSSCKKEEDEGVLPNISFKYDAGYVYSDLTLTTDTTIKVGINASKSENKDVLISFDESSSYDGGASTSIFSESLTGASGDSYSKDFTIKTRSTAGTEKYTFTVINRDGLRNSVSLTLTVN